MNEGFIIYISNNNLVKIFSKNFGIISAFANITRIDRYKWQVGTFVSFNIIEKNRYNTFDIDSNINFLNLLFSDRFYMSIFNSSINLINNILLKNEEVYEIYRIFYNLMFSYNNKNIILNYIDFLFSIIHYCGFSINLNSSVLSGDKNVYYISPKTGNCVTRDEGFEIKDKLFIIPKCFLEFNQDKEELIESINILHFFIYKFFKDNNILYKYKSVNFFKNELIKMINKSKS